MVVKRTFLGLQRAQLVLTGAGTLQNQISGTRHSQYCRNAQYSFKVVSKSRI